MDFGDASEGRACIVPEKHRQLKFSPTIGIHGSNSALAHRGQDLSTISRDLGSCIEKLCEAGVNRKLWTAGLDNLCKALNAQGVILFPRSRPYLTFDFPMSPSIEKFAQRFIWEEWYQRSLRDSLESH